MLANDRYSAMKMYYSPGGLWTVSLTVGETTRQLRYRYMVKTGDKITRMEKCECHTLVLRSTLDNCVVDDQWDDEGTGLVNNDLVARLLNAGASLCPAQRVEPGSVSIQAQVKAGRHMASGMKPAIVGEAAVLGSWNVRQAIPMQPCGDSMWTATVKIPSSQLPSPYKIILVGKRGEVEWESGENRRLRQPLQEDQAQLVQGLRFRKVLDAKSAVATLVEVAALRSDRDMGAGDLGDLKKIIQWAAATGQEAVVLGSLADRSVVEGWMPDDLLRQVRENAIDPLFISASEVGSLSDRILKARLQRIGMELNVQDEAPIENVRSLKLDYCRAVYDECGSTTVRQAAFRRFVAENGIWLQPYAAQVLLQCVNGTGDMTAWGNYATYSADKIEKFLKARHREASFIYFVQFHLRQQLIAAAQFAVKKKITLACDMTMHHVKLLDPKEPWVNQRRIEQRLHESSGIAVIPLHDWLLMDGDFLQRMARSTVSRLPVSVEEIIAAREFNARITSL